MIRIPKVRARKGRHAAGKGKPPAGRTAPIVPPPTVGVAKLRERRAASTRAQLADRYDRKPPGRPHGARETPTDVARDRHGTRNYPPRGNLRRRESTEPTRSQLAQRRAQRAAEGLPASRPHPQSAEGARSLVRARGKARRPSTPLRDPYADPAAAARSKHRKPLPQPELTGAAQATQLGRLRRDPATPRRSFASVYFGSSSVSPIGRPPR